ncbi:MAG TPA: hypothetical protein VK638_24155 [Edaphobacter sp.]|nr:hypothetical protein [Edaphobacter sp.]
MKLRLKHTAICVTTLLSIGPLAFAKDKARDWQPGTLVDSSTERGKRVYGDADGVNTFRDDLTFYKIDTGSMMYLCARTLRNRRDKALDVTINRPVQFAIDGSACYLQDAESKEHKLSLEQKIAK